METTKKISLKLNEKEMMNLLDQLYAQAKKGMGVMKMQVQKVVKNHLKEYLM